MGIVFLQFLLFLGQFGTVVFSVVAVVVIKAVVSALVVNKIESSVIKGSVVTCVIAGQGINSINKSERTAEEILQTSVKFGNSKTANLIKSE